MTTMNNIAFNEIIYPEKNNTPVMCGNDGTSRPVDWEGNKKKEAVIVKVMLYGAALLCIVTAILLFITAFEWHNMKYHIEENVIIAFTSLSMLIGSILLTIIGNKKESFN